MDSSFEIVVSAENNRYMQWQAMLFHFTCAKFQGQVPIIAVHKGDEPLLPGFDLIQAHGGRIQAIPNLRDFNNVTYPPRNSAAALRWVQAGADAEFIVLCDGDMIFLKPMPLETLAIDNNSVSFDYVGYLDPDRPVYQPELDDTIRAGGIDPRALRDPIINGGVPHIVPIRLQRSLGDEWLRCIDLFPIRYQGQCPDPTHEKYADWPYRCYLASMWAMVMAVYRLDLNHIDTSWCMTNVEDAVPMPDPFESAHCLLHYPYESEFDKHRMVGDKCVTDSGFWDVAPDDGSIAGYLRKQIRDAGRFYGLS